jgi:glucoamylase
MAAFASPGGMIPEQVWDGPPIPARRLALGRHTGSAMPLAWAHAEFVKLVASRAHGHSFDRPRAVWERYRGRRLPARRAFWWLHAPISRFRADAQLVIALSRPGTVRWGRDGWRDIAEVPAEDTGLGFWAAPLATAGLGVGTAVDFTIRWTTGEWCGTDWRVTAEKSADELAPAARP